MKKSFLACLAVLISLCSCQQQPKDIKRIAILTPITHPSMEQIEKGFIDTLREDNSDGFTFDVYNAQGNKTLMRSEIEEIIRRDYDLVFTLGTLASQMTTEVFTKKGLNTPIVFTCVNDPVGFHIVASEECPGNMATGVKELLDFEQELAYLLHYKPGIKKILLVYNPCEPGLEKDQRQISKLAQKKGMELLIVEVFQTNELMAKVPSFMEQADAVLILKDNCVVAGLDALVKLCNHYHIPLMASDLDSPDKGAAFGYGVHESTFGKEAAKKALLILNEGKQPSEIPVTPVTEFTLRVNTQAAKLQGVESDRLNP